MKLAKFLPAKNWPAPVNMVMSDPAALDKIQLPKLVATIRAVGSGSFRTASATLVVARDPL
jgi:hypothetical protein